MLNDVIIMVRDKQLLDCKRKIGSSNSD